MKMSSEETKEPSPVVGDKNDEASNEAETGANQDPDVNVDAESSSSNVVPEDAEPVGDEDHEDPLVIDEAEEKSDGGDSDEKVLKRQIDHDANDVWKSRRMINFSQ